jgi:hypothetical protein
MKLFDVGDSTARYDLQLRATSAKRTSGKLKNELQKAVQKK